VEAEAEGNRRDTSPRVARRCASGGAAKSGKRGELRKPAASESEVRQKRALPHRLQGAPTLASATIAQEGKARGAAPESFTIGKDGRFVGEDGFVVPKDFGEFFERDPLRVRRWVAKRLHRRFDRDTILDLEQELLLYLCTLPRDSRFRRKGANGKREGCTDVIQCFDPVRHYGAAAGRFHNFINLCLANRLSTILARQRLNPLCDPRNLSITALEMPQENASGADPAGGIDEAFLLKHSGGFAAESRRRARSLEPVLKAYVGEFERFVEQQDPDLLIVVQAIQRCGTLRDAERATGMSNREFRKCRYDLSRLKNRFLEPRRPVRQAVPEPTPSVEIPMSETKKVFLREELYERVWTTPVHRLAEEFGYSDVGLAKFCRKHQIPTPGLGYWRRLELGHKPSRTPLPLVEQPAPYQIELTIRERIAEGDESEKTEAPLVPVLPEEPISHPFVVRLGRLFKNAKKDEKALLVPRTGAAPHLLVTEETFLRALQILNALFAGFEQHGVQVVWPKDDKANLTLLYESETIGFCLSEILEAKAHVPSKEETERKKRDYWWSAPKWDYQPTGSLRISLLCGETTSTRKTWSDGKKRRLEEWLGEVIVGVDVLVRAIKKVKMDRQRWHEEFEAKQKRHREEEERAREFARKGEVISKAAQALQQSQSVRQLAVCLGNSAHLNKLNNESLSQMRELLEWCSEYANRIDPTCEPEILLRNFYKKSSSFLDR
jgi:hypothetical protein